MIPGVSAKKCASSRLAQSLNSPITLQFFNQDNLLYDQGIIKAMDKSKKIPTE